MRRLSPPEPAPPAELFGILLAGMFGQTREDCSARAPLRQELRPSGVHPVVRLPKEPER